MATSPEDESLPVVEELSAADVDPAAFDAPEMAIPYSLVHFHRLANAVRETGEDRGFIDLHVWRRERDNEPYNARIMENIVSLAYFYTRDRPWNVYRGDQAVRARLEAAIEFWLHRQHDDGRCSEYDDERWSLAPTAFATKFLGQALVYLDEGPEIDEDLHARFVDGVRDALVATFTDEELLEHGRSYSNQFSNAFAGAGAYLSLVDDTDVEQLLEERLDWSMSELQSPAGFFHEADAPDWSYNLGTHQSNLLQAHHYLQNTEYASYLVDKEERWADWVAYNALLEPADPNGPDDAPDGGFFLNCAGDVRNTTRHRQGKASPLNQYLEGDAGAFSPTVEECDAWQERVENYLDEEWPTIDDMLGRFSAFSPYTFLHLDHDHWYPTDEERERAREGLPYLASDRFVHQHVDDRTGLVCTHIRRPGYYAIVNGAASALRNQRFGLGIVWHPDVGTALQSRKDVRNTAYGTRPDPDGRAYEADGLEIDYEVDGQSITPEPGSHAIDEGDDGTVRIVYPLGDRGRKTITFDDAGIDVAVEHGGRFVESVPVLARREGVDTSETAVSVPYGDRSFDVEVTGANTLNAFSTPRAFTAEPSVSLTGRATVDRPIAVDKRLYVTRAYATDELSYRLSFEG